MADLLAIEAPDLLVELCAELWVLPKAVVVSMRCIRGCRAVHTAHRAPIARMIHLLAKYAVRQVAYHRRRFLVHMAGTLIGEMETGSGRADTHAPKGVQNNMGIELAKKRYDRLLVAGGTHPVQPTHGTNELPPGPRANGTEQIRERR